MPDSLRPHGLQHTRPSCPPPTLGVYSNSCPTHVQVSVLLRSAFFIVQLSHPYIITGKIIALTRQTFVDKIISLLFNMLSRLVITFLPRSSVQISSVTQSCPTLCDPMNRSTPGLPVHHQLPEFTQTHVHQVGDAIQTSHPVIPFSSCP